MNGFTQSFLVIAELIKRLLAQTFSAKNVWIPLMHRNLAATTKYCKSFLEAGKNLKQDIPKNDIGNKYVPRDLVQLDFWGPWIMYRVERNMF